MIDLFTEVDVTNCQIVSFNAFVLALTSSKSQQISFVPNQISYCTNHSHLRVYIHSIRI